jgi:hypothetical protein
MRFSLKWILVAAVYVAFAAAAFSQDSWVYADLLWTASLLALVFAALVSFLGSGKGRVAATGFLLASLAFVACVAFGQLSGRDIVPTKRWLVAAGYSENASFFPSTLTVAATPYSPNSAGTLSLQSAPAATLYAPSTIAASSLPAAVAAPPPIVAADFAIYIRAANAVGMMLFGAMGGLVGLVAFKRISQSKTVHA